MQKIPSVFFVLALLGGHTAGCGDEDGESVTTCAALCDLTPVATADEGRCVGNYMESQGHSIWLNPACNAVDTESECNACYSNVGASDSECAAAHSQCF